MPVKINIDKNAIIAKVKAASKKAVAVTAADVLDACNKLCPNDSGVLINTSYIHSGREVPVKLKDLTEEQEKILAEAPGSDLENGRLVWSTPYARYLYYGVLMVDPDTGSPIANKGANKKKTDKELEFHPKWKDSTPCKMWCQKAYENKENIENWTLIMQKALKQELKK